MTNGEKILNAFSNATTRIFKNKGLTYIEVEQNDKWIGDFDTKWWNSEYEEPITKSMTKEAKEYQISEDISKGFEEFTKMIFKQGRDATSEEQKSVDDYIKSISKPTGVEFDEEQEQLDFVQPHNKIPITLTVGDAISRQAAIGIIQSWLGSDTGYSWGEKNVMLCTIDQLRDLPSVSTEKTDAYKQGWHDAITTALKETHSVHTEEGHFRVVQEETLIGVGMAYEQVSKEKTGRCKDCKYFEYDSVAKVDGIPLIVAHEICSKWGDGCKTREDGYCFLFEPKMQEVEE